MVKHIVFWKIQDGPHGENAKQVKSLLESLSGKIPGLLKLEVGVDFSRTELSADVSLYTEFTDKAALDGYIVHPEHVKVVPFIKSVSLERRVSDYEV
jgi:hypothetical protein